MQEQSKREELLSEELLEWVTGAGCCVSTSRNPEPGGSFLECPSCQAKAQEYAFHIRNRDNAQVTVDGHVANEIIPWADVILKGSAISHTRAQEAYGAMEAHGHPDFPAALRQQRQNYNPPL